MPALDQHHSSNTTKLLLLGDSSSGKTGALASLASAGYNLRILDMDNGLDVLHNLLSDPKTTYKPDSLGRIHYRTITEPMKNVGGKVFPTKAVMWPECIKMLDHWREPGPEGQPAIDFGKLTSWGEKDVLVIDSLTMLSQGAINFHLMMNGKLGVERTSNEGRRDIGAAQSMLESLLQLLYDSSIKCNVIVISHITYTEDKNTAGYTSGDNQPEIGYPSAIGKALSPRIPRYFNSMLLCKTVGSGPATKRKIFTKPQGIVGAKSSAPMRVAPDYPIETGLAQYFAAVRGQ